jgi:hypothetical protein
LIHPHPSIYYDNSCPGLRDQIIGWDYFKERLEKMIVTQSHMGELVPLSYRLLEQVVVEERLTYYPPIMNKSV